MEVRYPTPQKEYLSDTCAIPFENQAKRVRYPLCDTISKGRYGAIWGVSRTGLLSASKKITFAIGCVFTAISALAAEIHSDLGNGANIQKSSKEGYWGSE